MHNQLEHNAVFERFKQEWSWCARYMAAFQRVMLLERLHEAIGKALRSERAALEFEAANRAKGK